MVTGIISVVGIVSPGFFFSIDDVGRIPERRQRLKNVSDVVKDTLGIRSIEGYSLMLAEETELSYTSEYPVRVPSIGLCRETLKLGGKFWDQGWRKDTLLEVTLISDSSGPQHSGSKVLPDHVR
ncbi:DNA damage response protein RcaA [Lasiodiplodia theobromae]|uniref:DNA damage response protein RcaA n=1 Tax=Lasiodiplodia theobromae TaxID=45133 RepID=UPI0015C3E10B|nr:DNA damage response protein RcaA [Lasiodiplodia theobromae]KAF4544460.1 DNA damage response protein RcaA [Lasiodiplodia theobromae]